MTNFNNQKGIAPILLILVVAAIGAAIGTGYYYITESKPQVSTPSPSSVPLVQPAPPAVPFPSVTQNSSIEQVKDVYEPSLLNIDGVKKVEVGEKDKKPCIVVFTFKENDQLDKLEDNGLAGYKVVVENSASQ